MEQQMSSIGSTTANVVATTLSHQVQMHQPLKQQLHHQQSLLLHNQKPILTRSFTLGPQSPALRPEDLRVKPWYAIDESASASMASKDSPPIANLGGDQSSCPVNQSYELDVSNHKDVAPNRALDAISTRTSSIESEAPRSSVPRKAYMDLNDAMALLDETCPNPDVSPQMTPRTPRTPLTPHPRNKRARSKSSDNSSNYSTERLNEKSDSAKEKERKRPFLKKIGISMTEDRPLLAKLAPKIIGKPYLEKIGPSRAIDKPFLERIGSSKTLDKFIFDTPKKKDIDFSSKNTIIEEPEKKTPKERRDEIRGFSTGERRRSGKNFLLKMYSFETEDLEDTSLAMKAPHKNPLRGASLDDVLDSGPNSMPRINEMCAMTNSDIETPSTSAAELVKCRITTSEEIISSNSCLNSPMDIISWGNSPKRKDKSTASLAKSKTSNKENKVNNESVPNSPTKRTHSITPEKVIAVYKDLDKVNGRQSSDEILDKRKSRYDQFETRSSDNLTKDRVATPVFAEIGSKNINGKGSNTSVISSTSSIRQIHDKFDSQEIFTETYAEFKRRTQGNALRRFVIREKTISPSFDLGFSSKDAMAEKLKSEGSPKMRSKSAETERHKSDPTDKSEVHNRRLRNRSVLRKQQGVDHSHYPNEANEFETETSVQRKIIHEPSQETLNLLSELQKVKNQLKSPSAEKTYELDDTTELKPFPKRILLTDKEFCLSVERENSIRRPSRVSTMEEKPCNLINTLENSKLPERKGDESVTGPALFEKRCLSLDYADDEKSIAQKTEPRSISLASARDPDYLLGFTESGLVTSDSKSYSSDVFSSPADEADEKTVAAISTLDKIANTKEAPGQGNAVISKNNDLVQIATSEIEAKVVNKSKAIETSRSPRLAEKIEKLDSAEEKRDEVHDKTEQAARQKNSTELDGTSRDLQVSPKKKSESFEMPSPKATPFRMKKRLGKISVEETVKQESFTVNKVDCKEVAVQKRAKCLPL